MRYPTLTRKTLITSLWWTQREYQLTMRMRLHLQTKIHHSLETILFFRVWTCQRERQQDSRRAQEGSRIGIYSNAHWSSSTPNLFVTKPPVRKMINHNPNWSWNLETDHSKVRPKKEFPTSPKCSRPNWQMARSIPTQPRYSMTAKGQMARGTLSTSPQMPCKVTYPHPPSSPIWSQFRAATAQPTTSNSTLTAWSPNTIIFTTSRCSLTRPSTKEMHTQMWTPSKKCSLKRSSLLLTTSCSTPCWSMVLLSTWCTHIDSKTMCLLLTGPLQSGLLLSGPLLTVTANLSWLLIANSMGAAVLGIRDSKTTCSKVPIVASIFQVLRKCFLTILLSIEHSNLRHNNSRQMMDILLALTGRVSSL